MIPVTILKVNQKTPLQGAIHTEKHIEKVTDTITMKRKCFSGHLRKMDQTNKARCQSDHEGALLMTQ